MLRFSSGEGAVDYYASLSVVTVILPAADDVKIVAANAEAGRYVVTRANDKG
ncbi:hypothetical protein [Ferrimicrobium sp.]|jgi:hypothetical protein|uniref:hypothetical protein n=1 Tax=Ferrimicrobium sp. TaxID=2926050 RepID=UPI00260F899D|nr:hypothetical protein [Ferrimicrobium sp.]MCL5972885.1 hypothetical protein [Actinomycetota bacterium]